MRLIFTILIALIPGFNFAQNAQDKYFDSLKYELNRIKNDTSRALKMALLCEAYGHYNFDSANFYGHQAIKLSQQTKFSKGEVRALYSLGRSLLRHGDIPEALELQWQALEIAEENHLTIEKARCLLGIGAIYHYLTDNPKAISYDKSAKQLIETVPDEEGLADLKIEIGLDIGRFYMYNNQLDSALTYLQSTYDVTQNSAAWNYVLQHFLGYLQYQRGNHQLV